MKPDELRDIKWPPNWESVKDQDLYKELRREVGPLHPLFWTKAVVIGRRTDQDDILVYIKNYPKPLAVVHLTWHGREWSPKWPSIVYFSSIQDWFESARE
jgi:hypothetical protein